MGQARSRPARISARLRRISGLSVVALAPYAIFIVFLSVRPDVLGRCPFGGMISFAVYAALFLFLWPVVVNFIYIRGAKTEREAQ